MRTVTGFQVKVLCKAEVGLGVAGSTPTITFGELATAAAQVFVAINIGIKGSSLLYCSSATIGLISKEVNGFTLVRDVYQANLLRCALYSSIQETVRER